jgi:hypothetical protein
MKHLLRYLIAISVLSLLSTMAFAQGTVFFSTTVLGTSARVYDTNGTPASGPAFKAQLYAAPGTAAESVLVAVGNPVGFRSRLYAGYVQQSGANLFGGSTVDPALLISAAAPGGPITVQLRAWDAAYATYEAALAANAQHGKSDLLALSSTGNPQSKAMTTPVSLVGLKGFKMVVSDGTQTK